nr:hypothetical protein [Micromonospora sp. DSM 115978]
MALRTIVSRALRAAGAARTPVDPLGAIPPVEVAGLPGRWPGVDQRAGIAAALIRLHRPRSRWRLLFGRQASCARCRVPWPCPAVRPALVVAAAAAAKAWRSL